MKDIMIGYNIVIWFKKNPDQIYMKLVGKRNIYRVPTFLSTPQQSVSSGPFTALITLKLNNVL